LTIHTDFQAGLRLQEAKLVAAESAFSPNSPRVYALPKIQEQNIQLYVASGDLSGKPHVFCLMAQAIIAPGRDGLSIGILMGDPGQRLSDYEVIAFSRANFTRRTQDASFARLKKVLDAVVGRETLLQSDVLPSGAGPNAGEIAQAIRLLGNKTCQ
jgi:hypothetical protein